jgi:hypothetical protein
MSRYQTLSQVSDNLINRASAEMRRSRARKYFDAICSALESAQLDPGAITHRQSAELARIAHSLQLEFQF